MSNSLEDERRAILERMSASRESYRNMFAHEDKHEHERADEALSFPRSHTFKFITRHPYYTSLAALVAVAMLPKGSVKKAVKGSAAVTAGILSSRTKTSLITRALPSMIRMMRSGKRPGQ